MRRVCPAARNTGATTPFFPGQGPLGYGLLLHFLFTAFFLMSGVQANSQLYEPAFQFNSGNGLNSNQVNGMETDRNGFTWLATNDGLVRFDGMHMRRFPLGTVQSGSSENVYNISWIAGELYATEFYSGYRFKIGDQGGIRTGEKKQVGSNYYENPVTRALYHFDPEQLPAMIRAWINTSNLVTLDTSCSEGYFINDHEEIGYFNGNQVIATGLSAAYTHQLFLYRQILYTAGGNGTLQVTDKGLKLPDPGGSLPVLIKGLNPSERANSGFIQKDTAVFYHCGSRLYQVVFAGNGKVDAVLLTTGASMSGISGVIYQPGSNMLLLATPNDGLYVFRKKYFQTILISDSNARKDRTRNNKGNHVFAVQPVNDSMLLTKQGLIDITRGGRIVAEQPGFRNAIPRSNTGFFIQFQYTDSRKLQVLDSQLQPAGAIETGLLNPNINAYTNEADTMYIHSPGKGILKLCLPANRDFKKLAVWTLFNRAYVLSMVKMPGDSLWVGTRDSGVYIFNIRTMQYRRLEALRHFPVTTLYRDGNNTIWLAVYEQGIYRYRQQDGLVKMPVDPRRILNIAYSFAEDRKGYLWVTSREGVFRFLRSDLDRATGPGSIAFYNYFSRADGLPSEECNAGQDPPVGVFRNGHFAIPTMNGLAIINPSIVPEQNPSARILISNILLDDTPAVTTDPLVLPPDFNTLSVEVAVPYYGNHYNLHIEYRLSGGDAGWTRLNDNRQITFNRLSHGSYTLTVRVPQGYGSSGYHYRHYAFRVRPFWYQTWWFIAILLSLLLALMALYFGKRNRAMKAKKTWLEEEVAHRTESLRVSEEKVRKTALFKSQVTSLVLHDVRSPLSYLTGITGEIYRSSGTNVPGDFHEQLRDLHLSVKEVSEYAQNLFAWVQAQQDDFVMISSRIRLFDLFEEVCGNYYLLAAQNQNTIGHQADRELYIETQADLLQIVLRNMVDNAIKYTEKGHIELEAGLRGDQVRIAVSDTGRGMSSAKVQRILSDDGLEESGLKSGMGYRYIKDLLKKMGGKLEMDSTEGEGTVVSILLPVLQPGKPVNQTGKT